MATTKERVRLWLYRLAAIQFGITALTGVALYFRPLDDRAGLYGKVVKEWLVLIHNGEWIGHLLFGWRYVPGVLIGVVLAWLTLRFVRRALVRRPEDPRALDDATSG